MRPRATLLTRFRDPSMSHSEGVVRKRDRQEIVGLRRAANSESAVLPVVGVSTQAIGRPSLAGVEKHGQISHEDEAFDYSDLR